MSRNYPFPFDARGSGCLLFQVRMLVVSKHQKLMKEG